MATYVNISVLPEPHLHRVKEIAEHDHCDFEASMSAAGSHWRDQFKIKTTIDQVLLDQIIKRRK